MTSQSDIVFISELCLECELPPVNNYPCHIHSTDLLKVYTLNGLFIQCLGSLITLYCLNFPRDPGHANTPLSWNGEMGV